VNGAADIGLEELVVLAMTRSRFKYKSWASSLQEGVGRHVVM
jgi:hypothetical protein